MSSLPPASPDPPPADPHRRAPRIVPRAAPRIAVVLGGGGLKGFAHLGVLRALAEHGVRPALYAGTSIGALIGAAAAAGVPLDELERRALALRRPNLFRLNRAGVVRERTRVASLYAGAPLRALVDGAVAAGTFDDLPTRLLVMTVDVARGTQVVWGLPGLRDASVRDAVYASCALPGFFPPGRVGGRLCVDGGTVDNLPVAAAARGGGVPPVDAVVAVDVGNADLAPVEAIGAQGFGAIFMRSASVMMQALQEAPLARWSGPPLLLVRPRVGHVGWLTFGHTAEVVQEGYRAATEALRGLDVVLGAPGGIFPRRHVRLTVDAARCTGCGLCAALAPETMALDARGLAYPHARELTWSPADGGFVAHCPTGAIAVRVVRPHVERAAAEVASAGASPVRVPAGAHTPGELSADVPVDARVDLPVDVPAERRRSGEPGPEDRLIAG